VESASDIIASKFEAKTYERNFMMRGRHFPKDIARSRQIIELERGREAPTAVPREGTSPMRTGSSNRAVKESE